jgi:group II intron reverse transcriptase/maturase
VNARLVRGRSAIAVLGSECCHWRTDEHAASSDEEVVGAAEPSMAMCPDGGLLLLGSSVHRKRGYMFRKWKELYGNNEAEGVCWFAPSAVMNPALPVHVVDRALAEDAHKARAERGVALSTLHHLIDLEWMQEAYRLTRKDGAPGIDGVMADAYARNLEANLLDLLDRIKTGRYQAPPVRRTYIPKADGSRRPLGIPTFEDKVAQRAIVMVLEAVFEQDFLPCSFGFRPGRSAHQALQYLRAGFMSQRLRWVIDIDIKKYFDSIPHSHLRDFLDRRVMDGVIRRMIDKWLKAGILEDGVLRHTTEGSPQGGVISPCLSNIFLHHVLDEWFEHEVRPRLAGRCTLVGFADDAVMAFEDVLDAKRVLGVLGKRLARYGLTLHPDKTRFVDFRNTASNGMADPATDGTTSPSSALPTSGASRGPARMWCGSSRPRTATRAHWRQWRPGAGSTGTSRSLTSTSI